MKYLALLLLATLTVGTIRLRQLQSYNIAVSFRWTEVLPTISMGRGRGWAYAHNGSPQSVDEMALNMGEDIQKAHPGEYRRLEEKK